MILGQQKYEAVIGSPLVKWDTPEDPGDYNKSIQAKDLLFNGSSGEKKYARRAIEYEKF